MKRVPHLTKRTVDENGDETTQELHFFYDVLSRPAFVEYEGQKYRYIHNLQGDVIAIVDTAGTLVVEYKYDAWGMPLSVLPETGLAGINPFRYRGYVFDVETEVYYLRSRYYFGAVSRFINGDCILPRAILLTNVYAYCNNNPVVKIDNNGCTGYSVYLNVYTDSDYGNKYGHYDISILSNDINTKVTYKFCEKPQSVDMLTISYGPSDGDDSPALLTFFDGYNSKATPTKQYVLFDDLSQPELDAFIKWITQEFIDVETMQGEGTIRTFGVKDREFEQYSIEAKKYCGSAAAKLIMNMREYVTKPKFSSLASKVLGLALFLYLEPQYVKVVETAQSVYNAIGTLFKEVTK